jgi:hypothetical protein
MLVFQKAARLRTRGNQRVDISRLNMSHLATSPVDLHDTSGGFIRMPHLCVIVPSENSFSSHETVLHAKHATLHVVVGEFSSREGQHQRSIVGEFIPYSVPTTSFDEVLTLRFFSQQTRHLANRVCAQSQIGRRGSRQKPSSLNIGASRYPPRDECAHDDRRERCDSLERAVIEAKPSKHWVQRRSECCHPYNGKKRRTDSGYKFEARAIIHPGHTAQVAEPVHG